MNQKTLDSANLYWVLALNSVFAMSWQLDMLLSSWGQGA